MSIHLSVLLVGSGVFLCCLFLHVFLWRIKHPNNHAGTLLLVFFATGAVLLYFSFLFWPHFSGLDLLAAALLHVSLSCAYIQAYPASQADSPSLKILVLIGNSMPDGMTETEIQTHFHPAELFSARIRDLLDARLIRQINGDLILTPQGRGFILPFLILRKLLGLSAGRG